MTCTHETPRPFTKDIDGITWMDCPSVVVVQTSLEIVLNETFYPEVTITYFGAFTVYTGRDR